MLSPDYMRLVRLRLVGFQTGMKCLYETGLNSVPVHMVRNYFIFKNPMGMLQFLYNLPAWSGSKQLLQCSTQKPQTGLHSVYVYIVPQTGLSHLCWLVQQPE